MSKTLKILLLIGVIILLSMGTCVGAGVWWATANADRLKAEGEQAKVEGESFAASSDQRGCLDEALRRSVDAGFIDEVRHGLFLQFCLQVAPPSEGFCDDVPPESSIMKTVTWRAGVCASQTQVPAERCQRLLASWQRVCHP